MSEATLKKATIMTTHDEALIEFEATDDNGAPSLVRVPVRVFGSCEVEYAGGPIKGNPKIEISVRTIAGWVRPTPANLDSEQFRASLTLRNLVEGVKVKLADKISTRIRKFTPADMSWTMDPFLVN